MLWNIHNKLTFCLQTICGWAFIAAQGESPRVSTAYSSSTITIQSSNDPYGVFSIQPDGGVRVSEPGSVTLIVTRSGGTLGQVGIRVRSVGGGEPWDDLIDATVSSGYQDTIGQVLAARNRSKQAIVGQDYQQLDTLLQFEEGSTKSSVVLYITDDTVPEDDENVFVYLQSQTTGARIAEPSTDQGLKGYAELVIEKNDYWNGWIGFYPLNSSKVTVDEDTGQPLWLTVERRNGSLQDLKLYWRAVASTSKIDLRQQLVSTEGAINCQTGQRLCNFYILINNDMIPENGTWFLVELYLNPLQADQGARIDLERRYANVTILPSDNPNGLIQFDDNSRFVFIDRQQDSIPLQIKRLGFAGKQVTVSYQTVQVEGPTDLGGTTVFAALEGADYNRVEGSLTFEPGQTQKTVVVTRDHLKASDNPYPKLFNVQLWDISKNAELGSSVASVVITEETDTEFWRLWAESQIDQTNGTIDNLMSKLTLAVQRQDLSTSQLNVITNLIDHVLDIAMDKAPLLTGVRSSMMRVFCDLLDPVRQDATRGQWQLSQRMDRFALSYVAHLKCDTCCQETFTESPVCDHVRFTVAKRYPEDINGYRWKARNDDILIVADGMLRVLDHGKLSADPKCYPFVMMDYSSDLWFTTRSNENKLLSHKIISLKIKDEPSRTLNQPINFRIHTLGPGTPDKKSECVYFDEDVQEWTSITQYGRQVCTVKNNLILALDNYVDCACNHLSLYAVKSDARNPDMIGYPIWFHISCFISMAGLAFAILAHHVCIYSRFSASLLMHMCFAVLATEVCYVIDAYLSPYHLLSVGTEDNSKCIVMSVFLHYFFMAQFTWMMVQAINYFKILVLNDEHTERKYVVYFLLGWGLPALLVSVFYIVTYVIYRFLTSLPTNIYGDVASNGDICFVTNPVSGLAGIVAPCLIFLMVVGIVFIQAYQMSPQWQSYDDIYKGRHNIHEVRLILLLYAFVVLTWLWGGLHMAYGQLWMLILFCVFNIVMGLYVFVVYTLIRLPCAACYTQQKAMYAINDMQTRQDQSDYEIPNTRLPQADSVKGSQHALIEEPWEKESIEVRNGVLHTNSMLRVKRTAPNTNIYVLPAAGYSMKATSADQQDSHDLNDLILALRAGEVVTSSDSLNPLDVTTDGSTASRLERKRISIADTHL